MYYFVCFYLILLFDGIKFHFLCFTMHLTGKVSMRRAVVVRRIWIMVTVCFCCNLSITITVCTLRTWSYCPRMIAPWARCRWWNSSPSLADSAYLPSCNLACPSACRTCFCDCLSALLTSIWRNILRIAFWTCSVRRRSHIGALSAPPVRLTFMITETQSTFHRLGMSNLKREQEANFSLFLHHKLSCRNRFLRKFGMSSSGRLYNPHHNYCSQQ